jgi:putative component of membrane protein insertase Oxa1/YidC/SpoIIIJ protein YidD
MKKIAIAAAVFVFILLLTKIANQVPPPAPPGTTFWLKAQRVIQCNATEITMVDPRQTSTHLYKDDSWPDCSTYDRDAVLDFNLARGDKTHFISAERTAWWRKAL